MKFISLPYYHEDFRVIEHRYALLLEHVEKLTENGIIVASPVLQYHPLIAKNGALLKTIPKHFWMQISITMLKACEDVDLLEIDGYLESSGVHVELVTAEKLCIPVQRIVIPSEKQYRLS